MWEPSGNTGQGSQITLKPGIAFCFRKHYGLVADMVKGAWSRYVRRFNVEALGDRAVGLTRFDGHLVAVVGMVMV